MTELQYLLTLQVNKWCRLALQNNVVQLSAGTLHGDVSKWKAPSDTFRDPPRVSEGKH